MTKKLNLKNVMTGEELMDGIINKSPYYKIMIKMLLKKDNHTPNIYDILKCYHEIAKVDHKL